jgi:hypothetical protein
MSTPIPVLVPMLVTVSVAPNTLPDPSVGITVVVTDSTGVAQPAVTLTGAETPTPWSYIANVAPGAGAGVAQAIDASGAPVAPSVTQSFNAAATPPTAAGFVPTALNFGPAPTPAPTLSASARKA